MVVAALAIRWLIAVLLIAAAAGKLGRADALREAIVRYDLLPRSVVPVAASVVPAAELLVGSFLAVGLFVKPAAVASACLFVIFAAAVAISLARGRRFDCGCGLGTETEISWLHVFRSTALIALSLLVAVEPVTLALQSGHARGASAPGDLVAVPLGILLLGVMARLVAPLRETISILGWSQRPLSQARQSTTGRT